MDGYGLLRVLAASLVMMSLLGTGAGSAAAQSYTVTNLGSLGGSQTLPAAINAAGQVTGASQPAGSSAVHAFLWSGGVMMDLGTLGGSSSSAVAINPAGQVLGHSSLPGDAVSHPFLWSGGVMTDLGTLGGTFVGARALNAPGQVVGASSTAGFAPIHAFLWSGGVMTDLGALGGDYSTAEAINDAGQVVGQAATAGGAEAHAFLWSGGVMTDLGTLGGNASLARGINAAGQVVGESRIPDNAAWHPFLWSGGVMTDLGSLGGTLSTATRINASGQVIGSSQLPGDAATHAFLWSGGVMTELSLGGSSSFPFAINAAGEVVGSSRIAGDAARHAFHYENGVMTDLNSLLPAGTLTSVAADINDAGQIIVFGDGSTYLLTPIAPPLAQAGPDQTVDEGTAVALDGSASTGDGLTYSWSQLAGPPVTLTGASTSTPSFTAPTLAGGVGGNQTLTFELTVTNAAGSSTDTVDVTVRNVNHAPVADAGTDQSVNEGSAPVTLSGASSYDPDADAISFQWVQTGGPEVPLTGADTAAPTFTAPLLPGGVSGLEVLTFELTVTDGELSDTATVQVRVEQVNHAPTSSAGDDQTKTEGSLVILDGTGSSDPDGDSLTYLWSQLSGPSVVLSDPLAASPSFAAPAVEPGGAALVFQVVVSDGALTSAADEVTVTVLNVNDPPACELARPSRALLWPPNHKLIPVAILGLTDPNDDQIAVTIVGVTQDEPINGLGDGDTSPDAVSQGDSVLLRAERSGTGNGRVYEVRFTADDGQGGTCAGAVQVAVPHSMKPGMTALDDGQLYDSTQP